MIMTLCDAYIRPHVGHEEFMITESFSLTWIDFNPSEHIK